MNTSKIGAFVKKKVLHEKFVCGICECEYKIDERVEIGKCNHGYCESCLHQYVKYKVGMFEEVLCPDENCEILLNTETNFFQGLPIDIQNKYKKLHLFY